MSSLTIRGIHKAFGDTPVLDGVDLDVSAGSLTAILGPSGCGKTTLLRLIAGFSRADSGIIRVGDTTIVADGTSIQPQKRRIGYVPQEGALFPHLDVMANIAFGLPRSQRRTTSKVDELLDLVGLSTELKGRYPHQLSGGQQQRVALARALAPKPSVVLLDEPFSSLDAGLRQSTGRAVVSALRARNATAVLVTHDQDEALSLADQVAVMRGGRLVQVGTPQSVYTNPNDTGVAHFVGAAIVIEGTIEGMEVSTSLGRLPLRESAPSGDAIAVIRPEQLELLPSSGRGVRAKVVEVSYFGHDAFVYLQLVDGGPVVTARVPGDRTPALDATVTIVVNGEVNTFPRS